MDTKETNPNPINSGPGLMRPDSTMRPPEPEFTEIAGDDASVTTIPEATTAIKEPKKSQTPFQESLRRLRRDKRAMVSLCIIGFMVVVSLIGPFIYQHIGGPYQSDLNGTVQPSDYHNFYHEETTRQDELPSAQYWLGTDDLGRDMLARLMQGLLISLAVVVLVELVDVTLGILVGVLAGFYGGWIDQLLARFTDVMFAFPGLLFLILISGIFGGWADDTLSKIPIIGPNGNARLLLVALALAFTIWPLMARYVRGQTMQLKEQQFIEAARTSGTKDLQIILRHVIPNLFSIVVIAATLDTVNTILAEAGISYLGLGVQAPGSSIGLMVSNGAEYIQTAPWEVLVPSLTLIIIVLAFSFLGDGIRDAFDPRAKD